jgi:hypothetical protein
LAEQVDLQRDQLKDQKTVNAKQIEVLDTQLIEMQRRTEAIERQQANEITLTRRGFSGAVPRLRSSAGGDVHMAVVENESRRPVRHVVCRISPGVPGDLMHEAAMVGWMVNRPPGLMPQRDPQYDVLEGQAQDTKVSLIRAGDRAAFVFAYEVSQYPGLMTLRFTDDARLHWQIDPDLHLQKLDSRDDW